MTTELGNNARISHGQERLQAEGYEAGLVLKYCLVTGDGQQVQAANMLLLGVSTGSFLPDFLVSRFYLTMKYTPFSVVSFNIFPIMPHQTDCSCSYPYLPSVHSHSLFYFPFPRSSCFSTSTLLVTQSLWVCGVQHNYPLFYSFCLSLWAALVTSIFLQIYWCPCF